MSGRRDIICFGLAEWDAPLPTNQHHLMRRFSKSRRVLFVDTVGTRRPRLAVSDLARIFRRLRKNRRPTAEVEPGIWRLSPIGPAPGISPAKRRILMRSFAKSLSRSIDSLSLHSPILWFFNPRASFVLEKQLLGQNPFSVFHLVDDLSAVPGAPKEEIRQGEEALAANADLVFASAPLLFERMKALAPDKTHYLPNVADFAHFNRAAAGENFAHESVDSLPRPRIMFAGNLTPSKIDYGLLAEMARARPAWQWVFIGPVWEGKASAGLQALREFPNAHFLGAVPYGDLPAFLAGADALIIPYKTDTSTESVCPLKFFEYLATGKPAVATPLPSLLEFNETVPLAGNSDSFLAALTQLLEETELPASRQKRIELARRYSWDRRMEQIEELLQQAGAGGESADA